MKQIYRADRVRMLTLSETVLTSLNIAVEVKLR